MKKTSKKHARCALLGSMAAASVSVVSWTSNARATATWVGGVDNNWSNPANWAVNHAPSFGENIVFRGPISATSTVNNDVSSLFQTGSINFTRGTDVTGLSLQFNDGVVLSSANNGQLSQFSGDVNFAGSVTVKNSGSSPIVFQNIVGSGSLNADGTGSASLVLIKNSSYTGKTIIKNGSVARIGGKRIGSDTDIIGQTSNQGDYEVGPSGQLDGNGTIGLSSGSRVRIMNGGLLVADLGIQSTQEDRIGDLTVNGDVSIESGGKYFINYEQNGSDPPLAGFLHVNGTLDLSSANDILRVHPIQSTGNVYLAFPIIDYQNRVGAFDATMLDTLVNSNVNISYTSLPGAGPGQVLITITPEPGAAIALVCVGAIASRRRSRTISS